MKRLLLVGLLSLPMPVMGQIFDHGFETVIGFPPVSKEVVDSVAGDGPSGVAIAQTIGGTYALVGQHGTNEVFSYALDLNTGELTPADNESTGGVEPVAIGVNGEYVIVANEGSDSVSVLQLDGATGALSSVQAPVSTSPGFRPAMVVVTDGGYIAVGNRNGILNVYRQNPDGTLVTYIAAEPIGVAMEDMADGPSNSLLVADPALGNVVLYRINPGNTVSALDSVTISDPVRVATNADLAYVASFAITAEVEVYTYNVENGNSLVATGADPYTANTVTDMTVASDDARLLVAHSEPPSFDDELATLAPTADGLEEIGDGLLGTGFSTRTVASVAGNDPGVEFAVVTRFDANETVVVKIEE